MAKTTRLIQNTDPDFTNAAHWNNGAPADGDTIGTTVTPSAELLHRPAAGTFSIDQQEAELGGMYDFDFLNGATLLNVTVRTGGILQTMYAITGALVVEAGGEHYANSNVTGTSTIAGTESIGLSKTYTGAVTVNAGGVFKALADALTTVCNGGIALAGTGKIDASGATTAWTVDTTTISGTGVIDWGSGKLDVLGNITGASATSITHVNAVHNASGNDLTVDTAASVLTLGDTTGGGVSTGIHIDINVDTTITGSLRCYTFDSTGIVLTYTATPTVTVGAGGYTKGSTPVGTFNLTFAATTAVATFSTGTALLTVNAGVTASLSASCLCTALAGSGTIAQEGWALSLNPGAAGWLTAWTGTITVTTGYFKVYATTNADPVGNLTVTGTSTGYVQIYSSGDTTQAWTGNITAPELQVYNLTNGKKTILSMTAGSALKLVKAGTATGKLKLGNGTALSTAGGGLVNNGCVCLAGVEKMQPENTQCTWSMGSSYVQCSGTLQCGSAAPIDLSTTAHDVVHIEGMGTGHIDYADPATRIHCHNMTDDGHNGANVDFDKYAVPGSLALCGVGV